MITKEPIKTLFFHWAWAVRVQAFWTMVITGLLFGGLFLHLFGPVVSGFFVILSLTITAADTRSRLVEYRQIRRDVVASGYNEKRIEKWLRVQRFAPCQRSAVAAAIRDIPHARVFYYARGYRWYHIFPDGFYRRLWSAHYWRCSLFKLDS